MPDVFVSYKKEDAERAGVIAKALEREGLSVWWDRNIPPGKTWAQVIESAINDCRCVLVLWTKDSVASDWVHKEARKGEQRGILLPALMEQVELPFEFEHVQAADLTKWRGNGKDPEFNQLVQQVKALVSQRPSRNSLKMIAIATEEAISQRISIKKLGIAGIGATSVAICSFVLFARVESAPFDLRELTVTGITTTLGPGRTEPIPVSALLVSGFRGVEWSAVGDRPSFSDMTVDLVQVSVSASRESGHIDLNSISIAENSRVSVTGGQASTLLGISGLKDEILVSVAGSVTVVIPDVMDETMDFGVGTALRLRPDSFGVDLDFTIDADPSTSSLLLESMPVQRIELYRIDQSIELGSSSTQAVSTIIGGELSSGWLSQDLNVGDGVRFDTFGGQITQMYIAQDTIIVTAAGTDVSGARFGVTEPRRSLMPRVVSSRGPVTQYIMMTLMAAYFAVFAFFATRVWRTV